MVSAAAHGLGYAVARELAEGCQVSIGDVDDVAVREAGEHVPRPPQHVAQIDKAISRKLCIPLDDHDAGKWSRFRSPAMVNRRGSPRATAFLFSDARCFLVCEYPTPG
jgi:hypothetical protein